MTGYFNSSFPYSVNDGAVWAGKGATIAASGGIFARYRNLSLRVEPTAFAAQNARFTLMANGLDGHGRFADPIEPLNVDAPQRFGDRVYARLDPGESTLRLDLGPVVVGASTAHEWWGPAQVDPLILGDNAAGIPRLFVGTDRPRSWGLGTVHLRIESGVLSQSPYAQIPADSAKRQMAGVVVVGTLRGLSGLEVGAARFYHRPWVAGSLVRGLKVPFEKLFKDQLPGKDVGLPDNQLASVFFRWVVAAAQLEAYGEYGRNDHSQDRRDLAVEPDHNSAYVMGLQRVWRPSSTRLYVFGLETMDSRITHLARVRDQSPWSQHGQIRQGHTQDGQLLGSAAGLGGVATTLRFDAYREDGRWTLEVARRVRQQPVAEAAPDSAIDVYNVVRVERMRLTRRGDVTIGVAAIRELNRDFRRDATSASVVLGWRPR
jgi:hypothetical protein